MYVAISQDDRILNSKIVTNKDNKYHSAFLISTIKEMLKENNMTPHDIEAIGTNIGPGSFTGIRACTTVARIMAQQLNLPAAGISSLEILAELNKTQKPTMVALDARKNSAYLYVDNKIQGAIQLEQIEEMLKEKEYFLITDDKLQQRLGGVSYQSEEHNLGEILAHLAYLKLKENACKWQELKPLYIQPPPMG